MVSGSRQVCHHGVQVLLLHRPQPQLAGPGRGEQNGLRAAEDARPAGRRGCPDRPARSTPARGHLAGQQRADPAVRVGRRRRIAPAAAGRRSGNRPGVRPAGRRGCPPRPARSAGAARGRRRTSGRPPGWPGPSRPGRAPRGRSSSRSRRCRARSIEISPHGAEQLTGGRVADRERRSGALRPGLLAHLGDELRARVPAGTGAARLSNTECPGPGTPGVPRRRRCRARAAAARRPR